MSASTRVQDDCGRAERREAQIGHYPTVNGWRGLRRQELTTSNSIKDGGNRKTWNLGRRTRLGHGEDGCLPEQDCSYGDGCTMDSLIIHGHSSGRYRMECALDVDFTRKTLITSSTSANRWERDGTSCFAFWETCRLLRCSKRIYLKAWQGPSNESLEVECANDDDKKIPNYMEKMQPSLLLTKVWSDADSCDYQEHNE